MKKIILMVLFIMLMSVQSFSQWEKLNFPGNTPFTLLETPQGLLAANYHVIYQSTDNGITWDSLSTISSLGISRMFQIGNVLLVNTSRETILPVYTPSIFRSDNLGYSWSPVFDGVFGGSSIAFSHSKVFMDIDGKLYSSVDTGKTWIVVNIDSSFTGGLTKIISGGNYLYALIQGETLYKSDDGGLMWDSLQTNFPKNFYDVLVQDSCIYVGTFSNGFYISKYDGATWYNASTGLPDSAGTRALHIYENNIIASISKDFQQSVYRYNLEENRWYSFNEGFSLQPTGYIYDFANNSEFLFLASDSTIWRRSISDLTDVSEFNNQLITDFVLFQNFPNPFNPTTTIKFSIRNSDFVTLTVVDVLGNVVSTLVNKEVVPGTYEVKFDGSNLSSGIYFYRLQSGNFSETKKLLLIK